MCVLVCIYVNNPFNIYGECVLNIEDILCKYQKTNELFDHKD